MGISAAISFLKMGMENIRKCAFLQLLENQDPFEVRGKNLAEFFN